MVLHGPSEVRRPVFSRLCHVLRTEKMMPPAWQRVLDIQHLGAGMAQEEEDEVSLGHTDRPC